MIFSQNNLYFKKMKKLLNKKYCDLYQQFLVFGEHLIAEAQNTNSIIDIYTTSSQKKGILISKSLMKSLKQTKTIFERVAICKYSNKFVQSNKILALDGIQDPANAGALLRSALAFGFNHILFSHNSVSVYNDKLIRASQGAIFHLFSERGNLLFFLKHLKKEKYCCFSTTVLPNDRCLSIDRLDKVDLPDKKVLILGNEGQGISSDLFFLSDYSLTIPTTKVESLNVAIAGSILMYLL